MKIKRAFFYFFPMIALVVAQLGAAPHALSHITEESPAKQEKQLPHSKVCEQCTVYAQVDSALDAAAPSLNLDGPALQLSFAEHRSFHSALILAAAARAPPYFL